MLAELGKNSTSRFRVQEGNVQLLGSLAGCLVDQANAQAVAFGKCVGHAVFDAEASIFFGPSFAATIVPAMKHCISPSS